MSAKVLSFPKGQVVGNGTRLKASRLLGAARRENLDECIVLGYDQDGKIYAASTEGAPDTLWLMEQAKKWILDGCPSDD